MVFFFFSSRRRHTRCSRDWSSDVCSSDLFQHRGYNWEFSTSVQQELIPRRGALDAGDFRRWFGDFKIGRAACRGRGEISVGAGSFKKKKRKTEGTTRRYKKNDNQEELEPA